jgi:hypothetical protein
MAPQMGQRQAADGHRYAADGRGQSRRCTADNADSLLDHARLEDPAVVTLRCSVNTHGRAGADDRIN